MPRDNVLRSKLSLQDLALLLLWLVGEKCRTCGVFKHLTNTLIRLGGAFKVLVCTNLLANILGLMGIYISNLVFSKAFPRYVPVLL